jgi:Flp pilus assembly protein TadG
MALELVIAFTLIVILVLTVVAFGRVGRARSLTEQAAADAARAASQATTPAQAHQDASTAATDTLSSGGVSCASMTLNLDTSQFHAGGQVVARLSCTASLADLAVTGAPGSITLQAQSASPVDAFRRTAP